MTLRSRLANAVGFFHSSTSTGAGAAGGTTVVDTGIVLFRTTQLVNKWLYLTSGTSIGQARRIASVSTSTITVASAFSAQVATSVTYEIMDHYPVLYHNAIDSACRQVYPYLWKKVKDDIVVDNLLANPSFELSESTGAITVFATYDSTVEGTTLVTDASHGLSTGDVITISGTTNYNGTFEVVVVSSSTFYIHTPFIADDATGTWVEARFGQEGTASGWTATAGTWTFPTSLRRVHGQRSATATASGAAAQLTQNLYTLVNIDQMAGKTLHIMGWDYVVAASAARLRVSFDGGTTFTNGDYHGSNNEWEGPGVQKINATIGDDSTSITVYCEIADGNTAWFDLVVAWIEPIAEYLLSSEMEDGPYHVYQQDELSHPEGNYTRVGVGNLPRSGYILRLEGMGYITVPAGDTEAVEVSGPRAEIIIAKAGELLSQTLKRYNPGDRQQHEKDEKEFEKRYLNLLAQPGMRMLGMGSDKHDLWKPWREGGIAKFLLTTERG